MSDEEYEWEYDFTVEQGRDSDDPEYKAIAGPYWKRWYTLTAEQREAEKDDWPRPPLIDKWSVHLPHQCQEWCIAYKDTHEDAVRYMEEFIAKAEAALERLKARQKDE